MKKAGILIAIITLVILIAFNIIFLLAPIEHNGTFFIEYIFTTLAFVLQPTLIYIGYVSSGRKNSMFLGLSIFFVSYIYLFSQLIACIIFTSFITLQPWIALVVSLLILTSFILYEISRILIRNKK